MFALKGNKWCFCTRMQCMLCSLVAEEQSVDRWIVCSLTGPVVTLRVGRAIALLFHDHGTRSGCVFSSTPRPYLTAGKDAVPIVHKAGWAPGSVWTGRKSRPTGIRSPDRPARSSITIPTDLPGPRQVDKLADK